jgi:hypothetical protein
VVGVGTIRLPVTFRVPATLIVALLRNEVKVAPSTYLLTVAAPFKCKICPIGDALDNCANDMADFNAIES